MPRDAMQDLILIRRRVFSRRHINMGEHYIMETPDHSLPVVDLIQNRIGPVSSVVLHHVDFV